MTPKPARLFHGVLASLPLLLAGCSGTTLAVDGPGAEVRTLAGTHPRVGCVQGDGTDPGTEGNQLVPMGFDSDAGNGERVILGQRRRSYVKPRMTARANRIVFSLVNKTGKKLGERCWTSLTYARGPLFLVFRRGAPQRDDGRR